MRSIIYKGDVVSHIPSESSIQIKHHQKQADKQFEIITKLPAAICLALFLVSGFAHADDNALIREANVALSQKDYSGAFSKFSILAQRGNTTAQFNLGAFYLNGQGVQRDEKQAYEWFAKSAAQGNARALQILQNAAAKGNENAKNELNRIQTQSAPPQGSSAPVVENSLLVEANAALAQKDYNTAFPKFLALAQQGNASAQYNVGAFYLNGLGVQKDEKLANDWFAKSAAQGNPRAIQFMQDLEAEVKAKAEAQARAKADAQARAKADAQAKADAKAKAETQAKAKNASHARSKRSGESSSFEYSLGVSLGYTGKMKGINNSSSLGLLAGYRINQNFGVEIAYNSLYRNANADNFISGLYPGTTATFGLTSISVAGQYTYDLGSNLYLLGNLGLHSSSYKINSSGSGSRTGSSSGLIMGAKVQYDLDKSFGIRGGFDTYFESGGITGNVTELGVAVITRF
jgi:uncharacterized protein